MQRHFFILILAVVSVISCDQIDNLTKFTMDYDSSMTIPSSTGINLPFVLNTPEMESNSESEFESNNTHKDLIEDIRLRVLKLTLTSPENEDFSFLESIKIFIVADGLQELEIAYNEDVASSAGKVLDLKTIDVDIKDYIKKDKFSLRVKAVTDEVITTDHHIDIHSEFFVDAKILGV
ncbi:hypothetical protein UMM65_04215 [Aureibaculum sp. 2210JD6-5]|uniref:hypothetical protein n=1 Tax=Aureibaculum sp. 2210JD6-5 TaxID=3103957 RepID=UPI002AADE236|nr:hypothetical protein [Aureibaculum sp. 2210JD6-5]MDY7394434.1 hypothetical protein [Aureibaculum sp. 2210JD6-5]